MWLAIGLALLGSGAITGDYLEDRANKVYGCYCEWSGEGEHAGREAVLAWSIRSGSYRGTDLAGVKVAAVIRGDRSLSRGGAVRRSILLVDSAATAAQRKAAEILVRGNYADLLGEIINVQATPLEFRREPARATLQAAGLLRVEMRKAHLVEDSLQGATLWYDAFIPLKEAVLGTTLHVDYSGADFRSTWSRDDPGITGYYGSFELNPR